MTTISTADVVLDGAPTLAYPTKRDEAWRYAPHRLLADLSFGPAGGFPVDLPDALVAQFPVLDGPRVVVVNGTVDLERSDLTIAHDVHGLTVSTLAQADVSSPTGGPVVDAYQQLNIMLTTDGAVIDLADDTHVDVPIHIIDVEVPGSGQNASCTGVVVRIGARSSATVIETRLGAGTDFGGSNVRTTITLADDATLEHVLLQDVPVTQVHLSRIEVAQGAGSTFRARSFNLGASYGRVAYDVDLAGEGAVADLSGLFFGFGEQILDQQINVVHGAPDCTSRQSFRGVLDDRSTGVFNGGIDVRPGADGTDAEQENHNLVLSDRAEVNTQPRLEILADEVACKHGATVGQLDDAALYYMQTRGIAADEARRLLINGFADQVVDDVGIESVRAWVTTRLGHDDV